MIRRISFTKMHGIGNDYIYINSNIHPILHPAETAIKWSRYHTGIGADGLVLIGNSSKADFSMRIFNADGSEAMMCGNASRCIGKYVHDNHLTEKKDITLETKSGIKTLSLHLNEDKVESVTVDMGIPEIYWTENSISIDDYTFKGTHLSMGNPHLVIFVDNIQQIPLETIGPLLEHHSLFPERTNVEFVEVQSHQQLRVRVWERGSGITQACGTGACAALTAAFLTNRTAREATVCMDGGNLHILWNEPDKHIYMTGPAVKVFEGTIEIEE